VPIIIDGVALADHPAAQVNVADRANRDDALPAFAVRLANHVTPADDAVERKGCGLATVIVIAVNVLADLARFEGVHAGKANVLTADFDSVAVDHGGLADDGVGSASSRKPGLN